VIIKKMNLEKLLFVVFKRRFVLFPIIFGRTIKRFFPTWRFTALKGLSLSLK